MAGPVALALNVRDATGARIDLDLTIPVIAPRDRTPDVMLAPGTDLAAWLRETAPPAGHVIGLEPGARYRFSFMDGILYPPDNPVIFTCPGGRAELVGGMGFRNSAGMIFEHLDLVTPKRPAEDKHRIGINVGSDQAGPSRGMHFYDLTIEGFETPVDPKAPGSDWVGDAEFAYMGQAVSLDGDGCSIDGLSCRKVHSGFAPGGGGTVAFSDIEILSFRDDGAIMGRRARGVVVDDLRVHGPRGNFRPGDHRDLLQGYGQGRWGATQRICVQNAFLSCEGVKDVQGILWDQDDWNREFSDRGENFVNADIVLRDTVVLGSHAAHLLMVERFLRGRIERCVLLPHPDVAWNGELGHRRAAQIAVSDSLIREVGGEGQREWSDLLTFENTLVLGQDRGMVTQIFPNWARRDLAFEDPRAAVAAGRPARAARLWIDPDGAWSRAHPEVGPAWLRTG